MKKLSVHSLCLGCVLAVSTSQAVDFKQSKVTQVVNEVQIISAADQKQKAAVVDDVFNMPDILRTGPSSRAELVAADSTVTRVGANTIFSFDPANRTIDLKQGSLLFHSPHGKGGGTIHTGSATASVLGSTLIVTTTASGGFKVLALEDEAEIKFLNGLKTKLQPGQMTFVLPGGNAISPIIIFRLDDLIGNSQLVKGFSQNLPSLPLILQQVKNQQGQINSGQLGDTGLNVGDEADSKGVKVIDQNTLQQALDGSFKYPEGFNSAISLDAHINQSSLLSPSIPTPPNRVFVDSPFLLPGNLFFTGVPFTGFVGKNVYVNEVHASPLRVNLSAYANRREFDLVALDTLSINGPVQFDGLSGGPFSILFSLVGGSQILVANGASIRADVSNFTWQSPGDLTFNAASIRNASGNTSFHLGSDLTFNSSSLDTAASLTADVVGDISLNISTLHSDTMILTSSAGSLNFSGSGISINSFANFTADQSITADSSSFTANSLVFNTKSGSVNLTRNNIQSQYLSVDSGDGILLDGATQVLNVGSATLRAKNDATVRSADLSNIALLNMSANTITVADSTFSSTGSYSFGTQTGQVNVNNGVNSGQLNLIHDSIGAVPITSAGQINLTGGPSTAVGIHSYAR
jgi:hypothetical protein